MVELTCDDERLHMNVVGLDKFWAFKSSMDFELRHVREVRIDHELTGATWKGLRAFGTWIPGVLRAGTHYDRGERVFWDVHNNANAIVIELVDESYDRLIVEVPDARKAVADIQRARQGVERKGAE